MLTHLNLRVGECLPIQIVEEDATSLNRIGGFAPEGVHPRCRANWTEYFASLAFDPETQLSIFVAAESPLMLWEHRYRIITQEETAVQLIVHSARPRSTDGANASSVSPHALRLGSKTVDVEGSEVAGHHKIGGAPFYYQAHLAELAAVNAELSVGGYSHLLQFTFPTSPPDARVRGSWPFAEWTFHVFWRRDAADFHFATVLG